MVLDQMARQNRWWVDPSNIARDRHIVRMQDARLSWAPTLPFRFDHDAIYTLRGPRQVGKTTVLKRQIQELLRSGWPAHKTAYIDVELAGLQTGRDLVEALRIYLDSERSPAAEANERCAIFLDEVTRVENWAGALRGLVDNDELHNVSIVATGSHTRDLREGGERLPGRRGGIDLDWELLPLSFREYVALVDPGLARPNGLTSLAKTEIRADRRARDALRPRLAALFDKYLATGGFLTALNDNANYGMVRAETFQTYRESVIGEFTRAGMRETYLREVINWLSDHLGQEFDYRDIATTTDIGSKDTARSYVDNLEASYIAAVFYRTPDLVKPSAAYRGSKKIHPVDPLLWHMIRAWAAADPDPWAASLGSLQDTGAVGHLVESVVANHLRRLSGRGAYYWRQGNRHEIDFVVAPPHADVSLLEVRYKQTIDEGDARIIGSAGGGFLLTRNQEGDLAGGVVYALPVAELLAILDTPSLAPCSP